MRPSTSSARWRRGPRHELAALVLAGALVLAASGCGRLGMYDLYTAPAFWIDNVESGAPYTGEFEFEGIDLAPDGSAWVVGDKFLLHADGEGLEVVFANPGGHRVQSLRTISATETSVWVGGSQRWDQTTAVIWRRVNGEWRPEPEVQGLSTRDRTVYELEFASDDHGLAVLYDLRRRESELARFDGSRWHPVALPAAHVKGIHVCQSRGQFLAALAPARAAAVYRLDGDQWQAESLPIGTGIEGELVLPRIACLADGSVVVAAGFRRSPDADPERWQLYRRQADGVWQELPFPMEYHSVGAFAIGGASADDLWISGRCLGCPPSLLHYSGGRWSKVDVPALPGGRRNGYSIYAIAFRGAGDGWAVGEDTMVHGTVRGIVFRYRLNEWQYRPWSWRFWNQPLWGLIGD